MKKIEMFCPEKRSTKRGVKRGEYCGVVVRVFFNGMLLCGEKSNAISLFFFSFSLSVGRFVSSIL